jgi:hypothetical protein
MENAARGKFPCKNKIAYTELNYGYMWQCIRRRQEANLRYLKNTLKGVTEGKTPPVGIMADWDEDLMEIDANYKNKREKQKKHHTEKFISQQLNLHKPRKIE